MLTTNSKDNVQGLQTHRTRFITKNLLIEIEKLHPLSINKYHCGDRQESKFLPIPNNKSLGKLSFGKMSSSSFKASSLGDGNLREVVNNLFKDEFTSLRSSLQLPCPPRPQELLLPMGRNVKMATRLDLSQEGPL